MKKMSDLIIGPYLVREKPGWYNEHIKHRKGNAAMTIQYKDLSAGPVEVCRDLCNKLLAHQAEKLPSGRIFWRGCGLKTV